jgi:hypothetical protein
MPFIALTVLFGAALLFSLVPTTAAQKSNATCIPSYNWVCSESQSLCPSLTESIDHRPVILVDKIHVWSLPFCKESAQGDVSSSLSGTKHRNLIFSSIHHETTAEWQSLWGTIRHGSKPMLLLDRCVFSCFCLWCLSGGNLCEVSQSPYLVVLA